MAYVTVCAVACNKHRTTSPEDRTDYCADFTAELAKHHCCTTSTRGHSSLGGMRALALVSALVSASCQNHEYLLFAGAGLRRPAADGDRTRSPVKHCYQTNNNTLDADSLIGTWYTIYKFGRGLSTFGISDDFGQFCPATVLTKPTKELLDGYKAYYKLTDEPFTFDDGAVLSSQKNGLVRGIIVGNKTAMFYNGERMSHKRLLTYYDVKIYKPVNKDYLIHYQCNVKKDMKYLWSRRYNQMDEELNNILQLVAGEVNLQRKQRICLEKKVSTTTPYF